MSKNNKNNKNNKNLSQEWFKIGKDEFNFAKAGLEELGAFYPQVCFQSQQAVEKYLKGFLVYHKNKFPKIHDLTQLLKLCAELDKEFLKFLKSADILSQYYLISRYPIEYPPATDKEAKEALALAEGIINFIEEKIWNRQ